LQYRVLLCLALFEGVCAWAAPQGSFQHQPVVFEPNRGQAPAQTKWIAHGPGYQLFFGKRSVTMRVTEKSSQPSNAVKTVSLLTSKLPSTGSTKYTTVGIKLDGSHPWDDVTGLEPTGGISNYFLGNDPRAWQKGVPHYAKLREANVYDGVDLVFYGNGPTLEYDLVVKPGADPKQIRLAFDGVDRMHVDDQTGDLVLRGKFVPTFISRSGISRSRSRAAMHCWIPRAPPLHSRPMITGSHSLSTSRLIS
jgi:hypothetical protein